MLRLLSFACLPLYLHRQKGFQGGQDLREKPYVLFRVKTDGTPVLLHRDAGQSR